MMPILSVHAVLCGPAVPQKSSLLRAISKTSTPTRSWQENARGKSWAEKQEADKQEAEAARVAGWARGAAPG